MEQPVTWDEPDTAGKSAPTHQTVEKPRCSGGDTESQALPRHVSSNTPTPRDSLWGRPGSAPPLLSIHSIALVLVLRHRRGATQGQDAHEALPLEMLPP